jgi:hypothetical protein
MKNRLIAAIGGAALMTLLVTNSASAHDHSSLNGTWNLVPATSDFAGQSVVQTGTVTINDDRGVIVISRKFAYEGASETFFYRDSQGSEYGGTVHTGKDLKSKTKWDHDVLKVTTTLSGAVTVERYALAADGTMHVSVVGPQQKATTLIFARSDR